MKIGNFIDLEVENEKMKVKSLKRPDFWLEYGHIRGKNKKCLNWSVLAKLLQKKFKCKFDKIL